MKALSLLILFFAQLAISGTAWAGSLVFQGVLEDTSTVPATPISNATGLIATVTYRNPADSCTLANETFFSVSTDVNGKFSVTLGTGSIGYTSPAASLDDVFNNSVTYGCYTPGLSDTRLVKVNFTSGPLASAINLSMSLGAAPFAVSAKVAGTAYAAGSIIGLPTCSAGQALRWDGSTWSCVSAGGVATPATAAVLGGVMVPASSEIAVDGAGNITAKTPNTANSLVKLDGTGKLPAVDGSQVINLNPSNLMGSVAISKGGTGRTSFNSNALLSTDVSGNLLPGMTCGTAGHVVQWTGATWTCAPAAIGSNSSLNNGKIWVGNASNVAQEVSLSGDANLTNAGVLTVTKLQGYDVSAISPSPGKIMRFGASQWTPSDLYISDVKSSVAGGFLTGSGCLAGQALVYSSVTDQITCSAIVTINLQSRPVAATIPTTGQFLVWDGTQWTPSDIPTGASGMIKDGGNTTGGTIAIGTNDNNAVAFKTNSTNRMTISNNGKVGFGTNSPSYPFEVRGAISSGSNQGVATIFADISSSSNAGLAVFAKPSGAGTNDLVGLHSELDLSANISTSLNGVGLEGQTKTNGSDTSVNSMTGVRGSVSHQSTNVMQNANGGEFQIDSYSTMTSAQGIYSSVRSEASGTINSAYGVSADIGSNGSSSIANASGLNSHISTSGGAITNAKGLYISMSNGGGVITNSHGIYIDNLVGSNKWSIYANDPAAPSYFAGNVGIGVSNPSYNLHVAGNAKIQGGLDMSSQSIANVAAPVNANDAANKQYVDKSMPWMKRTWAAWPAANTAGTLFISGGGASPGWSATGGVNGTSTYFTSNIAPIVSPSGINGYYSSIATPTVVNWAGGVLGSNFTYAQAQPLFEAGVYISSVASVRYTVGLVSSAGTGTSGSTGVTGTNLPTTTHSAYFRYSTSAPDTTWMCMQCNGTACTPTSSGVSVTAATPYNLKISIEFSTIKYYINGTLVCDTSATMPNGTVTMAPIAAVTNLIAATTNFGIYKLFLVSP